LPAAVAKPAAAVASKPNDWRESWGKANEEPAKPYLKDPLPQASTKQADPLANPEPYGAKPAEQVASQPTADCNPNTDKAAASSTAPGAGPDKKAADGKESADNKPKPKKSRTLFGGIHSMFARKNEPVQDKKAESARAATAAPAATSVQQAKARPTAGVVQQASAPAGPAAPRMPAAPPAGPPWTGSTPLGVESIFAAGGGVPQPVRYVPVPVVTLPNRTRPPEPKYPEPPPPDMPEAPQPNQKVNGLWVNAFTSADALQQQQQPTPDPDPMMQNAYSPMLAKKSVNNLAPMNFGYGPQAMGMLPATPYGAMAPGGMYPPMMGGPRMYPPTGMYPPMMANVPGAGMPYPPTQQTGYASNMPAPGLQAMYPPFAHAAMGPARQGLGSGIMPVGYFTQAGTPSMPPAAGNRFSGGQQSAEARALPQLLEMLENSMFPSQREWAADKLATYDWRVYSTVVQALMTSAAKDPAATVRVACVRSLGKMNVSTVAVIGTIQGLKADRDLRVRQEVEQTLATLIPTGADK
jgi:hypothetical protein